MATREDVAGLEVQIARIEKNMAQLEKRQAEAAASLSEVKGPIETLHSSLADTQNLLNNFNPRFEELRAMLDNLRRDLIEKILDLESRLDQKIQGIRRSVTNRSPAKSESSAKGGSDNPIELYQMAYQDFQAKKWDLAEAGFSRYLKNYPTGAFADESLFYWSLLKKEQKDYPKAKELIEKLSKDHPKSALLKGALLAKAEILFAENKPKEAEGLLEFITINYPQSKEASRAKELLELGGR